jgi:sterol desaturase/sphingolipid hydroxylase (fatty acid hydroxylase superfamily)
MEAVQETYSRDAAVDWISDFLGIHESPEFIQWLFWSASKLLRATLLNPDNRLFGLYLLTFLALAAVSFSLYHKRGAFRLGDFLKFCFPWRIYRHPSAIVDYQVFLANLVLSPVTRLAPVIGATLVATFIGDQLVATLGPGHQIFGSSFWATVAFTVASFMIADFASYLNHAAHHFIPALWPFHSVHHSAEVMTPVTLYRKHPLYDIVNRSVKGALSGVFQGIAAYFLIGKVELVTILGVNFAYAVFSYAGANLRHSHIWLSFGPVLNHIFISPAQHQIHHSVAPKHMNKNFGQALAIWDWMFGTLYIPKEREELVFGIGYGRPQPHPNLLALYTVPFIDSWRVIKRWFRGRRLSGIKARD